MWDIAQKLLGNGTRYKELVSLNNLHSNIIYPGQVLKIRNNIIKKERPAYTQDALLYFSKQRNHIYFTISILNGYILKFFVILLLHHHPTIYVIAAQ